METKLKKPIRKSELPHYKLCKDMDVTVGKSLKLFDIVTSEMTKSILSILRKDKLAKSEDFLKRGWTGKIPLIKVDIDKKIVPVIDRYLSVLMYFMLGDYAGKEAKKAAIDLGFKSNIVPGGAFGAYLQAIDAQRDYFQMIYDRSAPEIQKDLLEASFKVIQDKTKRIVTGSLEKYKNSLIDVIQNAFQEQNINNVANVQSTAHDNLDEGLSADKALKSAIKDEVELNISAKEMAKLLSQATDSYKQNWETNSETLVSMSSSAGTHQAMVEVFGAADDNVKVALVNVRDERCCDKCEEFARKPDGSLRLYNLSDFKPSGYNYGKKMKEYQLSIAPIHHRCFDKETEVLTDEGWMFFKDLSGKEQILSVDLDTGSAEFVKIKHKISYLYEGLMEHFRHKWADFMVTPNHNHVISKRRKDNKYKWQLVEGEKLPKTDTYFLATIPNWQGSGADFISIGNNRFNSIDFVRFLGIYLSEGNIAKPKKGHWQIKISQVKYHKEMAEICKRLFDRIWDGKEAIYIPIEDIDIINYFRSFGHSHQKFIPADIKSLDIRHLSEFLNWFIKGDGTDRKLKKWKNGNFFNGLSLSTSSKRLASDLSEIGFKLGMRPSFTVESPRTTVHKNGIYTNKYSQIHIRFGRRQQYSIGSLKKELVKYNDYVYDVELEKFHTLITRRKGRVIVSGNCRCSLVYVPKGFKIADDGTISPAKKAP